MDRLNKAIEAIKPLNKEAMEEARNRQDYLAKVPGSLGMLEDISIRLAGITGKPYGNEVKPQGIIIMCADNGIVEEGVASAPQSVTLMQSVNFTRGITGVSSQARYFGIDLLTVDVGINNDVPEEYLAKNMIIRDEDGEIKRLQNLIVHRKIARGTRNFIKEPAMTLDETLEAIMVGVEAVNAAAECGIKLLGIGEMGIGNTTTASAIICALTGKDPAEVVGRGGGLSDEGLALKEEIVKKGLEKYAGEYLGSQDIDGLSLVRTVGGLDIAAMTGAYIGAAAKGIPVVIDGVISIAAALVAKNIAPGCENYMFASHKSKEGGYASAAEGLGIRPMFDLDMKLGEGSGCPIAFKIIEAACAVMNNMRSLDEAQVDGEYLDQFRGDGQFTE